MTFGDYILQLRTRLQDTRDEIGSKITSGSSDGVRWSSSELIEICNVALEEFYRLIVVYEDNKVFNDLLGGMTVYEEFSTNSSGIKDLSSSVYKVTSVCDKNGLPYVYVDPEKFTLYQSEEESPRKGSQYYSVFYDISTKKKHLRIIPAEGKTLLVTYIYGKSDYQSTDLSEELPVKGFGSFLLDLAEKEARAREHNWDRYNGLLNSITLNLGSKVRNE